MEICVHLQRKNDILAKAKTHNMKRLSLLVMAVMAAAVAPMSVYAIDKNTVEVVFNGTTATVTIADNISSYVTCSSGTSSHVVLVQNSDFAGVDASADNEDGEIIYSLKGTSSDGQFYMEGSYKCTVELNGLTLTNTSGPAICVMNGKRVSVSVKKNTTNTLADAADEDYKGCFHSKGHTKFKGKGTLNIAGNYAHAIYSKEYVEVKNVTLNIAAAVKDGIHCKEYFLMESGTLNISNVGDDGIQVELDGAASTGAISDHEDEDSGNFYQEDGTLKISNWGSKAIKADGTVTKDDGTWSGFTRDDIAENNATVGIGATQATSLSATSEAIFDIQGRKVAREQMKRGVYVVRNGQNVQKINAR